MIRDTKKLNFYAESKSVGSAAKKGEANTEVEK
jgi:hypothetical protein